MTTNYSIRRINENSKTYTERNLNYTVNMGVYTSSSWMSYIILLLLTDEL